MRTLRYFSGVRNDLRAARLAQPASTLHGRASAAIDAIIVVPENPAAYVLIWREIASFPRQGCSLLLMDVYQRVFKICGV